MTCPIPRCPFPVDGPLRLCKSHYSLVPLTQREALSHYARTRKGGPSHKGAYERAVESVMKTIQARTPKTHDTAHPAQTLPYRDD